MNQLIKIAVFECDNHIDPDRSKYGGYGGLISTWLRSHHHLRERAEVRIWNIKHATDYPKPEEYDVIVIIGSPANPQSQEIWITRLHNFIKKQVAMENDKKFVGLCFGHQIMAMAYGLSVGRNRTGYELAVTPIQLSETGKQLFKQDSISLNQCHLWDVIEGDLKQIQNMGSTDHTKVQGLFIPGRLWSLQAHPEFDQIVMGQALELARPELSDKEYRRAEAHNTGKVEQQVALEALVNFILQ